MRVGIVGAVVLGTMAQGLLQAQEPEAGAVGEAYSAQGYQSRVARTQGLSLLTLSVTSYAYGDPTPQEQMTLELINRARANPTAEAQRFGISLNQGLPAGTISTAPKQPLTFEQSLIAAARKHAQWMLDTDTFSHTGTNGTNSKQRMEAEGYPFAVTGSWGAGENIAWKGTTGTVNLNTYTIALHEQLFRSATHRENIMANKFDQVGIGLKTGKFLDSGTDWNAVMVSQDYAFSAGSPSPDGPFVTGVVYKDANSNGAYDIGEGLGGVSVNVLPGDTTTSTASAGGYAIPLGTTSGAIVVTFSGGALANSGTATALVVPGVSVKVDHVVSSKSPVIAVSGSLNFGSVTVGSSVSRTLTIKNTGNAPLVVSGISHSHSVFTGNFSGTISAGNSKTATITFAPTAVQAYSGTLTVGSNAGSASVAMSESGSGVTAPVASTPVISPDGGAFGGRVKVKITTATTGATIRFTNDGSEPTAASPKYSRAFTLKATTTVKAKAFKTGFQDSATASATFTKN